MSLEHILLGYLRRPSTGYELGRQFADGARHFWYAERSQIYPALKKLEARGWLKARDQASPVGPDRRVYEITAAGRKALTRWLTGGPQIGRERLPYIAQAFFLDAAAPGDAAHVIEAMRGVWQEKLAQLEALEQQHHKDFGDPAHWPAEGFHPYTALRMGIHQYRAKVAWCAETLDLLAARAAAQPVEA
jgi:DNA-binding PadR family transcriptional regulator